MLTLIVVVFVLGYLAIAFEHNLKINKSAPAILTGVLCWTLYIFSQNSESKELVNEQLQHHLGEVSGILFFLMGAMTIVELIDAHDGFEVITSRIATKSKRKLLWIVCVITFFLSAVLDNLTTTIVMVSLLRKILSERNDRLFFLGMVVVAANAGGAWSPIGDVTTTMLWIGGQITAGNIIIKLIVPSLVCMLVPLLFISTKMKGTFTRPETKEFTSSNPTTDRERNIVFFIGIAALIFVPVFKTITHLPPYMGVLFGLGLMWIITELIHSGKDDEDKDVLSVVHALRKIDVPSILFFLGILLAITSLESTHQLHQLSEWLNEKIGNMNIIVITTGILSSVVDNVPLVAAAMGMYDLNTFPQDHYFWEFMAYCAGTGGSLLIIGSAAGVAAMGMEKIDFFWYIKKITFLAAIGYFAGCFCYIGMAAIFGW